MPELPEVETIARALAPRLTGRHILSAEFLSRLVLRHSEPGAESNLRGRRIERLERRGKFLVMHLDRGVLTVHLGMTGKLLMNGGRTPYTRAIFSLDDSTLMFDDVRQFGSVEWSRELPNRVGRLGPEPLEMSAQELFMRLSPRKAPVKASLLNQAILRGVGNIYADEALFRAGIRPTVRRLSRARATRLHAAVVEVLTEAIQFKGSSVSDYVDTEGRKGSFQNLHRVYGREGEPCVVCQCPIRRIVVSQRGTHYCPKCQK